MAAQTTRSSRRARVGWGILLVIATLMVLNGVTWFSIGPEMSASYVAEVEGVTLAQFTQAHPELVAHMGRNAQQVAVWFAGFGLLAILTGLDGFRTGSRRAWMATWLIPAVPIAIGLVYLGPGLAFDNVGMLGFGGLALIGQLLATESGPTPSDA